MAMSKKLTNNIKVLIDLLPIIYGLKDIDGWNFSKNRLALEF